MKRRSDVNDTLKAEGLDAVRARSDKARPYRAAPSNNDGHDEVGKPLPFVPFDDINIDVQKPWLHKHVMAMGETSSWIGGPFAGKSALLTDIVVHAAARFSWRGYKCKERFAVIYLAYERANLTKRRLEAYKRKYDLKGLPLVVISKPVNLMVPASVPILLATIKAVAARFGVRVGLVVIDTFGKCIAYGGGDENQAKDQNRVRGHLRDVQEATGVHIALVGHTGKDESKGERGSNANTGDVDVEVRISGDEVKAAIVTHANDQAEGPLTRFCLEPFSFGVDEDDEAITVHIVSGDVPAATADKPKDKAKRLPDAQKVALRLLDEALIDAGERAPTSNHIPHDVKVVSRETWKAYCAKGGISGADTKPDATRVAFDRAVTGLLAAKKIGLWDPYVWRLNDA